LIAIVRFAEDEAVDFADRVAKETFSAKTDPSYYCISCSEFVTEGNTQQP
jgi:hypothetical protein